jgi:hypothetical protein
VPHQRLDAHDVRGLRQLHGDEEVVRPRRSAPSRRWPATTGPGSGSCRGTSGIGGTRTRGPCVSGDSRGSCGGLPDVAGSTPQRPQGCWSAPRALAVTPRRQTAAKKGNSAGGIHDDQANASLATVSSLLVVATDARAPHFSPLV